MNAQSLRSQDPAARWRVLLCCALALGLAVGLAVGLALASAHVGAWRLFVVVGLAPVLEEIVFRAGLQAELTTWLRSAHGANMATSALFALAHGCVVGSAHGLAVMLPSLLLGECWRRWQRLGPCVVLHAAMNAGWLLGLDAAWTAGLAPLKTFAIG